MEKITVDEFKDVFGDKLSPFQVEMLQRFEDLNSLEVTEYAIHPPVVVSDTVTIKSMAIFNYKGDGVRGSFTFEFDK